MYLKITWPTTLFVTSITAASSLDALSTVSALVSYGNAIASSLGAAISASPIYTPYSQIWIEYSAYLASATSAFQTVSAELEAEPTLSAVISQYLSRLGPEYSSLITHPFTLPTDSAAVGSHMASISTLLDALQGGYVPRITGTAVPGVGATAAAISTTTATRNAAPSAILNKQLGMMGGAAVGVLGLAAWL